MEPIITSRARDLISTGIEVLDQDRPPQALLTEVPFIKQTAGAVENVSGMFNLTELEEAAKELRRKRNQD